MNTPAALELIEKYRAVLVKARGLLAEISARLNELLAVSRMFGCPSVYLSNTLRDYYLLKLELDDAIDEAYKLQGRER